MSEVSRRVVVTGCFNVRDLGGLPLAGGGETAYRVVVRADSLPGLTEAGRRALVDYGVSLVVNLRPLREDEEDPVDGLPVPVVRAPMDPRGLRAAWPRWERRGLSGISSLRHSQRRPRFGLLPVIVQPVWHAFRRTLAAWHIYS